MMMRGGEVVINKHFSEVDRPARRATCDKWFGEGPPIEFILAAMGHPRLRDGYSFDEHATVDAGRAPLDELPVWLEALCAASRATQKRLCDRYTSRCSSTTVTTRTD